MFVGPPLIHRLSVICLAHHDLLIPDEVNTPWKTDDGVGILLDIELSKQAAIEAVDADFGTGTDSSDADNTLSSKHAQRTLLGNIEVADSHGFAIGFTVAGYLISRHQQPALSCATVGMVEGSSGDGSICKGIEASEAGGGYEPISVVLEGKLIGGGGRTG